jgi:hypothetical protein
MRRSRWNTCWFNVFVVVQWLSIVVIAVFGGVKLLTPSSEWHAVTREVVNWVHSWGVVVIPAFTSILAFAKAGASTIGPPWIWKLIDEIIDELRDHVFDGQDEALHHHRVTLFKHVRSNLRLILGPWRSPYWPWGKGRHPWSGWLVPISRSKHTTINSKTVFLAPDDADNAEGIAGHTWARDVTLPIDSLPDVNADPSEANIQEYSNRTWVSVEWVRSQVQNGKPLPRSLVGIPIEVSGNRWGVIVFDSRSPEIKTARVSRQFRLVGLTLGHLLKRVN